MVDSSRTPRRGLNKWARVNRRYMFERGGTMSDKPTYLGLLNAVAVGELGGEKLFAAWSNATDDDDVRGVLHTVALREAEHARTFAKRINELGYSVRPLDDPKLPRRVAIAKSKKLNDREKFEKLGFARIPTTGPDIFSRFFDDITIDIQTGEMLGRYLSEERDTARRLSACHAALCAAEGVEMAPVEVVVPTAASNKPKSAKPKSAKLGKKGKKK